jgi:hypothetical protein
MVANEYLEGIEGRNIEEHGGDDVSSGWEDKFMEDLLVSDMSYDDPIYVEDNAAKDKEMPEEPMSGEIEIQVGDEEPLIFDLPSIPGADNQDPFDIQVDEEEDVQVTEEDPMKWTLATFPKFLMKMLSAVPRHSGRDIVGVERAIAYMQFLEKEISKAVKMDIHGALPIDELERAKENIFEGVERLQDRLEKLMKSKYPKRKGPGTKKKSEEDPSLVKNAKAGKFIVSVPLFISAVARTCINSMVSAGKDIEDCFEQISKEYELTKREQAEVMQLLADMNFPMRRPRMTPLDKEIDTTSTDNLDYMSNYPG